MMIYFSVVSTGQKTRVEVMHSHFGARPFVVGVLGLGTVRGMSCECWYCCRYVVEFV